MGSNEKMKLHLAKIAYRGIPNKERIIFQVLQETNLYNYVVYRTSYSDINAPNAIITGSQISYWFPPAIVRPGDQVILYSGFGQNVAEPTSNNTTNFSYYWEQKSPLWSETKNCAVLFELNGWETSPFEELKMS